MNKAWTADWIQDPVFAGHRPYSMLHKELEPVAFKHPEHLKNRHTLFRKTFMLTELPKDAVLDLTADDYYKLYINGVFVSQGPAQGYPFHYYYHRLDVRPYLREGENVLAVHVYYHGGVNRSYNSGDMRQGLIAELAWDGRVRIRTDRSWRVAHTEAYGQGPSIGYETQYLEMVDSRLARKGWSQPGYDDSDWAWAEPAKHADYTLVLQPTPPVSVYEVRPVAVHRRGPGHYLVDFGTELTGQFAMKASGRPGQTIEIRCGEELEQDGFRVRHELRCNCTYREVWTLSGTAGESPDFYDYKAFRYVEVEGPDEAIDPESFGAVVRHYPLDWSVCQLRTNDDVLNRIWDICKRAVQFGSQEQFVDCPSREKGQYLGDNTVIGHSHLYVSGDPRLFGKAIEDFALSAKVCPGLLAVAPGSFMQEIADYSLQWPMQLWQYYRFTGDADFLRRMAPIAEGILGYFKAYENADGLLESVTEKWNLVDWPDNLRDGYDFPLTRPVGDGCHNVINAWYYGCKLTVNAIREALGKPTEDLSGLKKAFVKAFYHEAAKLFVDARGSGHSALHSNVLPLLFGLAPEEAVPAIVNLIRRKRLSCGVYFSYFVLKALAKVEEYDLVYELIRCEDERSWVNMLREGATTCFEAWGKEQKWNTSLCHPWASAPIPLLIEEIVGLKPAEPGWRKIRFRPRIPKELGEVQFEMRTPPGRIRVKVAAGHCSIEVPDGVDVIRE